MVSSVVIVVSNSEFLPHLLIVDDYNTKAPLYTVSSMAVPFYNLYLCQSHTTHTQSQDFITEYGRVLIRSGVITALKALCKHELLEF